MGSWPEPYVAFGRPNPFRLVDEPSNVEPIARERT